MSDSSSGRSVRIPEHLWEALETMSREMGVARDGLVNQAIFVFARLNGYLAPGQVGLQPGTLAEEAHAPPPPLPAREPAAGRSLFVIAPDGGMEEVAGDRYVIGRGSHCNLVINSTKVSREHAALVRDGEAWFIEDLGSSNGTWFEKERVGRKRIADGDEFFICSEKIRCVLG